MKNINENYSSIYDYFPYGEVQVDYLINCSKKYRYAYVETPKVACSTVKRVLQIMELDGDVQKLPKNIHDRKNSPLQSPLSMGVPLREIFEGDAFFRFSFVRNPYSRILSAYLDKMVKNDWERNRLLPTIGLSPDAEVSMVEFLERIKDIPDADKDIHWTPQSYLLQSKTIKYHYIGRFENFSNGFNRVIEKIKPDANSDLFSTRADSHRTDASKKVLEYIGRKERDLILEIYQSDFEEFKYSEDPHFGGV